MYCCLEKSGGLQDMSYINRSYLKGANPFAETGLTFGLILEEFVFRCLSLFFVFFIFFYFGFVCFVFCFCLFVCFVFMTVDFCFVSGFSSCYDSSGNRYVSWKYIAMLKAFTVILRCEQHMPIVEDQFVPLIWRTAAKALFYC